MKLFSKAHSLRARGTLCRSQFHRASHRHLLSLSAIGPHVMWWQALQAARQTF